MNPNCDKWFYTCLALIGLVLAGLIMVFRYFLRIDKKSVELGTADKEHENKHSQNEQRIKKLEEKNGKELREMELLKTEITTLKEVINQLIGKPINHSVTIPTPPPPPLKQEQSKPNLNLDKELGRKEPSKPIKKGGWDEIHKAIKKRRKDLGEE